ncbi:hypothetical protein DEU56DRAFT_766674 [Suillus clintonianus]|uniref:uncharacterized protein n=1 Tax=Suillus clintonianus TaxID=1904413 RepID=UPI001B86BF38|nr:uncharacterized protein DEU56DRAFT_766674 [Suillus clintonianus]KAG2156351.1 hypothetical protein DEU56DRAFT_766674 [Suillus clintonianus]
MALDWTMLDGRHQPIPLRDEITIMSIDRDSQAEFSLTIPDAPPSGTAATGGNGGVKNLKERGKLWLTNKRLIFTTPKEGKTKPSFESLSVPLDAILSSKFEQPYFGANYVVLDIRPSPDGGLTDGTSVEIRFYDRGLFEFVSVLEKTRERVVYMKRQAAMEDDENLPAYTSSGSAPAASNSYADTPPGYDA